MKLYSFKLEKREYHCGIRAIRFDRIVLDLLRVAWGRYVVMTAIVQTISTGAMTSQQ